MIIGFLRLEVHIPGVNSLKEKRTVIKSMKEKAKNRFNISIAEIGKQDRHEWSEFGIVTIGNDSGQIDKTLKSVTGFFIQNYPIEITRESTERF